MKQIPEAFAAHLAGGATTTCLCWALTRSDGMTMGFTDHDRALAFDGVSFEPEAGFEATEIVSSLGLSPDNLEVAGAISSQRLAAADLEVGRYDAASVTLFLVNWQAPDERVLLMAGTIGEVRREDEAFAAEIRGLASRLDQERGRIFQFGCDAELGDARCRVSLDDGAFHADGTVSAVLSERRFRVSGLEDRPRSWFAGGGLAWTGGANDGLAGQVRLDQPEGAARLIEVWRAPDKSVEVGDTLRLAAGCDRQFGTCGSKFGNQRNYRGFPHMPGNDYAVSYASRDGRTRVAERRR